MAKKTVADLDVSGKRVLMRVDFNVPLDEQGNITDDLRITQALPSIRSVLDRGGRLILMSHLGRPKGRRNAAFSLEPVAAHLATLLGQPVPLAPDCIGAETAAVVDALADGQCCMLENVRFHAGEEKGDPAFAGQIAALGELYVNDAFGTCHRKHASMLGVPEAIGPGKRACGFLVEKELQYLGDALENPQRPFVAILGGAKVSSKIGVIEALLPKVDALLIGGAMNFTFMAAAGLGVGDSLVELEKTDEAKRLRAAAGDKLHLPTDMAVTEKIEAGVARKVVQGAVPDGLEGVDIGGESIAAFCKVIAQAKTIVWNGPMGVFEVPPFDEGTFAVARAVADATAAGATSIIGGGDSAAAIAKLGISDKMSHISTGGGASLEFLEGKPFAPVEILDDKP
jgi:phosphoglycerate kinase